MLKIIGLIGLILWCIIAPLTYQHWSYKRHCERMKEKSLKDGFGYGKNGKVVEHNKESD